MNYSTNYSMREPVPGEKVKVADINYNTEIIDGVMLDNRQISIDMYDDTSTYNTDDLAGHENSSGRIAVYRCLQNNTTGAWDDTKWVQTNLADEITDIRGNAGASDLGDLGDVEITTPTDGQALLYDPTSSKWHNSDLPDADVTKTASGNPIEFEDGADAPLVKCVTEIVGSQDLHGYDKPWVGGAGKNKLLFDLAAIKANNTSGTWNGNVYTYNGVTYTVNDDGTILVNGATGSTTDSSLSLVTLAMGYKPPLSNIILSDGVEKTEVRKYGLWLNASGYSSNPVASTYYSEYQAADLTGATWSSYSIGLYIYANATLSNVLFKPMIRLATETDPTFAPYSNICPITAYTEGEIEVRGKNLCNPSKVTHPSSQYIWGYKGEGFLFKAGTSYTLSIDITVASTSIYSVDETTQLAYAPSVNRVTYTPTQDTLGVLRFYGVTALDFDNAHIQLEIGTSPTTYEPYTSTTHTTTFPSAIYRGSEDVVNGEVTEEWKVVDLGDFNYVLVRNFQADMPLPGTGNGYTDCICEQYIMNNVAGSSMVMGDIKIQDRFLQICDTRYNDGTAFKSAVTGIKLAYKLATPTTTPVTPTNLPIKSLSGYNHIESTTGDMEIEYFPAKEQPLIDLIPEASNMHEYSTAEQIVGTWVDGKTVYEQTYIFTNAITVTTEWTSTGIASDGIDAIIDSVVGHTTGQTWNGMGCLKDGGYIKLANPYGGSIGIDFLIIRYTKPTVSRSLAKGEPEEETKEEQVEELKEEPTEETKEEPTEETKEEPVEEVKEEETKEEGEVNER